MEIVAWFFFLALVVLAPLTTTTAMLDAYTAFKEAKRAEEEAHAELDRRSTRRANTLRFLTHEAKKRSVDTSDWPTFKRHLNAVRRIEGVSDQLWALSFTPDKAWTRVETTLNVKRFGSACARADRRGAPHSQDNGAVYYVCDYNNTVRLCTACWANPDVRTAIATNERAVFGTVSRILDTEHIVHYSDETVEEAVTRALVHEDDQWRFVAFADYPSSCCCCATNDTHRYLLVGHPRVGLCSTHYHERNEDSNIRAKLTEALTPPKAAPIPY